MNDPTTTPDGNVEYSAAQAPAQGRATQAQIARDPNGGYSARCDTKPQPMTFRSFPELAAYLADAFGESAAPPDAAPPPGNDVMTEQAPSQ